VRAAFTGTHGLTFMDYIDGETGRTLTAEPGGVYEVVPGGARPLLDLPPGFTPVEPPSDVAEGEDAPDTADEGDGE
jgi:hypothetical protein